MSVFEQNKLTLPPELKWEAEVKEEDDDEDYFDEDIIILSTDDSDEVLVSDESSEEDEEDTDMEEEDDDSEEEEDVGVPVVFVVDKHYVSTIIYFLNVLTYMHFSPSGLTLGLYMLVQP